jgi:hypothetical protein
MSKEAHFVWMDWIHQLWPKVVAPSSSSSSVFQLVDSIQLPTAAGQFEQDHNPNVAMLLSLAATRYSSTIDMDLTQPPVNSYNLRSSPRRRFRHHLPTTGTASPSSPLFVQYERQDMNHFNMSIVEFRGDVGVGDRCIRAKEPLAKPMRRVAAASTLSTTFPSDEYDDSQARSFLQGLPLTSFHETHHHQFYLHHHHHHLQQQYALQQQQQQQQQLTQPTASAHTRVSFLDMICRGSKAVAVVDSHHPNPYWHWKPFVLPHVVVNPNGKVLLDLTPRLVSYFEVSILDHTAASSADDNGRTPAGSRLLPRHLVRSECVAVGVASPYFDLHSRMPGWDSFSFGYHGDDGGIFHSSGVMLRPYGPCFGVGDTVGCGIDYTNGGIFFTLNSKFLGYAWTGISNSLYLQQDLYPVVGVDTHSPISCNFGERPFAFDLSTFLQQHDNVIKDCFGLSSDSAPAAAAAAAAETLPSSSRLARRRG